MAVRGRAPLPAPARDWRGINSRRVVAHESGVVTYVTTGSKLEVKRKRDDGTYVTLATYDYDANGRVNKVTDADGVVSTVTYSGGRVASITALGSVQSGRAHA